MAIQRFEVGARMSQIVIHGGIVYLSGQVADDDRAPIDEQTRQVLAKIDPHLATAGTDKSQLLTTNIWLKKISDFAAMNEVWNAWVAPGQPPARATVEATLARPSLPVEIMVTAAI